MPQGPAAGGVVEPGAAEIAGEAAAEIAGEAAAEIAGDGEVKSDPDPGTFSYHRDAEGHLHLFI